MGVIEIATVSDRGQVAIPADIRKQLDIKKWDKLLFLADGETVLMKKAHMQDFLRMTEPLRRMQKKIQESDVVDLVHESRKKNRS